MKRIIIFNSGSYLYGAERGLLNLVKSLSGCFHIICVIPQKGPLEESLKRINPKIRIKRFPFPILKFSLSPLYYLNYLFTSLVCIFVFSKYVTKNSIDIICTNNLLLIFPAIVARITSKKHIWYIREFFKYSSLNLIMRKIVEIGADIVICQSKTIKEKLGLKQAKVIYEPIDEDQYKIYDRDKIRKEYGLYPQNIVISIISRIHPLKGQFECLKKLKNILDSRKDVFLLIVGDITPLSLKNIIYKVKIERFIKNNRLKNVIVLGFQKDISKILSLSDICIFPFLREEPFGIACMEALSFRKVVFFPERGGLKEIAEIFKTKGNLKIEEIEKIVKELPKTPTYQLLIPHQIKFSNYKNNIISIFNSLL